MQPLFYFLWSLLCRIVGIALNFYLQLFDTNHWDISYNRRQMYRRRMVDTRRSLYQQYIGLVNTIYTLLESVDL
jgi:hypothetical protein